MPEALVGIVNVKVPAVMVWLPNVNTATALFDLLLLYISSVSNAVVCVRLAHDKLAEGVQYPTPAVVEVLADVGDVPLVTVFPPAV